MPAAAMEKALKLIQADSPEAIDQALALLQNTVYSFSMKVCGHPEDAEDTMQDVLIKLLPYLPKFESPRALSVWLYKVARNRCLMNRRGAKNSRSRHISLDELMPTPQQLESLLKARESDPEIGLLREERDSRLRNAVQAIPPLYRMTLVLHDMEELGTAGVAEVTGVREGTVRVRLHRARLLLRQELARMEHGNSVGKTPAEGKGRRPRRSRQCREVFASLSDYLDGLLADARLREMEKHVGQCEPCVAFLHSLKSAVTRCRTYEPVCDMSGAEALRKDLVEKYRAAVAALPNNRW